MASAAREKSKGIDQTTQWDFPKNRHFNFLSNPLEEIESRLKYRLSKYLKLDAQLIPKLAACLANRASQTFSVRELKAAITVWFEEDIGKPIDKETRRTWARVMIECSNQKWVPSESAAAAAKK